MNTKIKNFFYPNSICIVGASSKEKSIGYEILKSIKTYGFTGDVYAVNPKSENILGFDCYKSISEINKNIDLAIIVVPKKFVDESINQLIRNNVSSIILITAGYKETGDEGESAENKLLELITQNNIRLVGPNCMGVINTLDSVKLNATFVAEQPQKGGIGFLSQSGALGAAVLNSLKQTDIRFAHFISVGNKTDISELDILKFWLEDKNIKTITFYLESLERGIELLKLYNSNSNKKPLIILKAGRTSAGMHAASSHTGALSSNNKVTDALLKQFGIIRAQNLNEMFNTAKGFEYFPVPKGNKIAIVTNAGGPAILAVDKLEDKNLILSNISQDTINKLKEIVHPEGCINNPVDLLPGGTPEIYKRVNEILLEDQNIDAIISIFVEPVMVDALEVIQTVNSISSNKPIYQVCMPLPEFWNKYIKNTNNVLPIFKNPEDPAEIISNILQYETKKNTSYDFAKSTSSQVYKSKTQNFLNQSEIEKLCKSYSLPIINQQIISSNELGNIDNLSYPIVLKGLNPNVVHKSELNAVLLNIKTKFELNNAKEEIVESFNKEGHSVNSFLIQPFVNVKHELLIGGFRDPSFGPIVMFGTGGKYVEYLNDTQIKSAHLNDDDLNDIIRNTNIGKILCGVRGEKPVNFNELKKIIKSIANMLIENDNITEIDLNPLVVDSKNNFHAVDVRIKSIL